MTELQIQRLQKHLIKCEEANKKGIEYNAEMRYRGITLGITNALDYVGSKYKSYRIAYVRNRSNPYSMDIIRVTSLKGENTLEIVDQHWI